MSPSAESKILVDASAATEISRSWWPKQSSVAMLPVLGLPSRSTRRVVALSVVTHTGSSSRSSVALAGGFVELPGAQPRTIWLVSCEVGTMVKPQSQVELRSVPPSEPEWAPTPATATNRWPPVDAKRTAWPAGEVNVALDFAGTAMVPEHPVQVGVTVIADALGL